MGQTEQKWKLNTIFRGLHWQVARTTVLLLPIFQVIDYLRRRTTAMSTLTGSFLVTFGVVGAPLCYVLRDFDSCCVLLAE